MVIRMSAALEERVARAAKEKGIEPEKLIEKALEEYLIGERQPEDLVSAAARQLDELLEHMRKPQDFNAEIRETKRRVGRLLEDNAEVIERSARHTRAD